MPVNRALAFCSSVMTEVPQLFTWICSFPSSSRTGFPSSPRTRSATAVLEVVKPPGADELDVMAILKKSSTSASALWKSP